jgi:ABC-2 type transport system ATP-binding protein
MNNVIEVQRLTKYYGGQPVVDSLDLRIPAGSIYGFLGRNGAGKSTTIKMLLGMVQPTSGRSTIFGEDSRSLRPETRGRVAYLAEGHPLYRWMTIGELVRFSQSFYPGWNRELVEQILDHFELPIKKRIKRLSNGQRAQVSLAVAVASEPELLVLDDPTLGLDVVVRRDFLESLIQVIQRKGRTIFFSSHILGDVERVADRIAVIDRGVLRADCPTDVFKQSIRRVVVEFDSAEKAIAAHKQLADLSGLVGSRIDGARLELVIVRYGDEHRQRFESLGPKLIELIELNLEEAFIEYTRGRERSLPSFQ